ncbi:MAG: hypothetical protein CL607_18145 [Anaerolineaceae bacterium]|nr:hypothetical protein [Anaerolineaceae bacterium]
MVWIQARWRWVLLNLFGLAILLLLLHQVVGGPTNHFRFGNSVPPYGAQAQAMLESGKWSVRFLLISLSMTPMDALFRWRWALGLRKSAGLWAFAFGSLHFILYATETDFLQYGGQLIKEPFLLTGLLTLSILTLLALTSNRFAMRWLGKIWKRLHRLVYAAGLLAILHGLLAAQVSKKVVSLDPSAPQELRMYLAFLIALLLIRVPIVRARLFKRKRKPSKHAFMQSHG